MSFFGSIANIGKSIIKSPITTAVAGGVAVVFPPVGVPAVAAVATANRALALAESTPQGKAALAAAGAIDKALSSKRAKSAIISKAKQQLARGVPKTVVKASMLRQATAARRIIAQRAPASAVKSVHRTQLAQQLAATQKLAARGDKGAKRAMATFKLVAQARKGNPVARKALAVVAHRYEVGQRVRSRFELTAHGRIRSRV